eukprot:7696491-Pyramimonas_sp.AAC.2
MHNNTKDNAVESHALKDGIMATSATTSWTTMRPGLLEDQSYRLPRVVGSTDNKPFGPCKTCDNNKGTACLVHRDRQQSNIKEVTLHDGAVSVLAGKGAPSDRDGRIEDFLPLVNAAAAEGSVFN